MKTAYHTGQYVVFLKRPRSYRRVGRCRIISDLIDETNNTKRKRQYRKENGNTEKKTADGRGNGNTQACLTDWVRQACIIEHYLYVKYILLYAGAVTVLCLARHTSFRRA